LGDRDFTISVNKGLNRKTNGHRF